MVHKCFDKKTSRSGIENKKELSKELVEQLHKPIIRKFNERKVHSTFIGNIRGADLADMQLINKFDNGFSSSLCIIDIYSKYARVITLKDKKGITIANAFQKNLKESKAKENMGW